MDSLYLIDKSFIEEYDLSGEALAVAICIKIKCQNNKFVERIKNIAFKKREYDK